jgi:CheY-like chemotaxis protein
MTRTILLVEDEGSVRQVTRCVLESAGYLVLEANGPEQAISIFLRFEGAINLLLTDVVMPNMSGSELAAHLKETHPGFITMFMSGYAKGPGLSQQSFGPPDYYLQKPFSTSALLSRVAEALSLPPACESVPELRLPV